jgi:hypothetical protein
MAQDITLLQTIHSDLTALRAAVPALWDTDSNPDTILDAERMARDLAGGVTVDNITKAGDFFQLMAAQEHLDSETRQRAEGAAFLVSFCLTNADVVACDFADA